MPDSSEMGETGGMGEAWERGYEIWDARERRDGGGGLKVED